MFWWYLATLLCFATHDSKAGEPIKGTCLAQSGKEVSQLCQELHQAGCHFAHRERAKKEDQEGFVITGSPSFLESVRNSFSYSLTAATKQNDMVLSEMRSPEQSQSREVQGLLAPLERGMGALQTQSTKPQQIEEGSTGATQQRKCGGKLAGFSSKSSLDYVNTWTHGLNKDRSCGRRHGGGTIVTTSTGFASTSKGPFGHGG
jgi:hypothetical protein